MNTSTKAIRKDIGRDESAYSLASSVAFSEGTISSDDSEPRKKNYESLCRCSLATLLATLTYPCQRASRQVEDHGYDMTFDDDQIGEPLLPFSNSWHRQLPLCQGDSLLCAEFETPGKTNELHRLITKKKWHVVRLWLQVLNGNFEKVPRDMQYQYRGRVEEMIREVDENGRTPLSIATGKCSAPADIVVTILQHDKICARILDVRLNLPIHYFCHSYQLSDEETKEEETEVLEILLQAYPIGLQCINANGNTPLHLFLEQRCGNSMLPGTADLAVHILGLFPGAAWIANKDGSLPMHMVGRSFKKNVEGNKGTRMNPAAEDIQNLIEMLHRANPEAIRARNILGATPFFMAVISCANIDFWKALLCHCPLAAVLDNGDGITPIVAHWNLFVSMKLRRKYAYISKDSNEEEERQCLKNQEELSKIKNINDFRQNASPELIEFWDKMTLMLVAGTNGNFLSEFPISQSVRLVHTICSIRGCPVGLLKFALRLYPLQAEETDERGDLPLHIMAELGGAVMGRREARNIHNMIKRLTSVHPYGATVLNSQGRLPLHLALASGKNWMDGVKTLLDANKDAIRMPDPKTGFFPFMIPAALDHITETQNDYDAFKISARNEDRRLLCMERLNTSFELLKVDPNIVFPQDRNEPRNVKMQKTHYELLKAKATLKKQCRDFEESAEILKANLQQKEQTVQAMQKELQKLKRIEKRSQYVKKRVKKRWK